MPTRKTVSACYHSEISVNQAFIISYTFTSLLEITGKEEVLLLILPVRHWKGCTEGVSL